MPPRKGDMSFMPTIIDVARRAGVSTATVSRVLSQPERVSEKTRLHVLEVVETLGYSLNVAARTLRTLRAAKLLVTVPDISNPFFANVIRGAEEAARDADYSVVLGDTRHDPALENQYAAMLHRREVDGLVFLGHRIPEILMGLLVAKGAKAPIVNGCEYSPDLAVPSVHIDNAAAGADVARYLLDLGHREIGIVTGPTVSPISRDRLAGVREVALTHGVAERLCVEHGDYSVESGAAAAERLIAQQVTAIFCFSDEMAVGVLSSIRRAGLECPRDISVIGFDDIRLARFLEPALTTIRQPQAEIGRRAVEILLQILRTGQTAERQVTLPYEFIVRSSTAPR